MNNKINSILAGAILLTSACSPQINNRDSYKPTKSMPIVNPYRAFLSDKEARIYEWILENNLNEPFIKFIARVVGQESHGNPDWIAGLKRSIPLIKTTRISTYNDKEFRVLSFIARDPVTGENMLYLEGEPAIECIREYPSEIYSPVQHLPFDQIGLDKLNMTEDQMNSYKLLLELECNGYFNIGLEDPESDLYYYEYEGKSPR